MGSPIAPLVADVCMNWIFDQVSPLLDQNTVLNRYVDDIFCVTSNQTYINFKWFILAAKRMRTFIDGPEMETGPVDRHRSGRDSSTGWSSRLKYRSNSPFLQLKNMQAPTEIYIYTVFYYT